MTECDIFQHDPVRKKDEEIQGLIDNLLLAGYNEPYYEQKSFVYNWISSTILKFQYQQGFIGRVSVHISRN